MTSHIFNITIGGTLNGDVSNITNPQWYTTDGTTTAAVSEYRYDAYNLLFSTELIGWERGSPATDSPYNYGLTVSDVKGDPTIGIGIDLYTNPGALSNYFGVQHGIKYNALAANYATDSDYVDGLSRGGATGFTIRSDQSEAAFKGSEKDKEDTLNNLFHVTDPTTGNSAYLADSTARLALLDILYNSSLFGTHVNQQIPNSPRLPNSPHLLSDLATGNQADAWFQIAFASNGYNGTGTPAGDANTNRRWEDAALLGLYPFSAASDNVTVAQAESVYAMLSGSTNGHGLTNRQFAFNYSNAFASRINSVASPDDALNIYALTNANIDNQLQAQGLGQLQTGDLASNLEKAGNTLISNYVTNATLNPWVGSSSDFTFDPLDIQVATAVGGNNATDGNDLVASQRSGYQLGSGSYKDSLLIAQDGNDTLDGTGSGNDALIGGTGNDVIIGGSGNDYIVAGTGNDSITLTGGNDTVVLGEASNPGAGGRDTVHAESDAGSVVYYVGQNALDTLYLSNVGSSQINVVSSQGMSTPLSITARSIGDGRWFDPSTMTWITKVGSTLTVHYEIVDTTSATTASTSSGGIMQSLADLIVPTASADDLSSSSLAQLNAAAGKGSGVLTLYNFTGTSEDGITLQSAPTTTTPTLGASNLSALDRYSPGDTTIVYDNFYGNDGKHGAQMLDSIYGSNTDGGVGSYIDGFGNASFIYAGDGDNTVIGDNGNYDTVTGGYDNGANPDLYVLGGTGNQLIYGNSSGKETLQGGDAGAVGDFVTIFGSGADASISLGTEDGYAFGGTGADTLDAGDAQSYNVLGVDTFDAMLFAGITYDQNGDTISSINATGGNADTFQVYLDGMALLGSALDPGVAGSSTLPGSLLIGGTGNNLLVGNVGDDTIIGGTESVVSTSMAAQQLFGGAGSDLIIAGDGTDVVFADLNPVVANWANLDPTHSDTIYGGAGHDEVYGSGGSDYFYGGSGSFNVSVGNGASYVYAGSGATTVVGGSGGDYIEGGSGVGLLVGGTGNDTIFGGSGASSLYGWGGNDYINGGGGNDYLMADKGPADDSDWANAGSGGSVTIDGGGGNDTIFGSGGSNLIFAGSGIDAIELGNGASTVDAGAGAADTFYAGGGDETFIFEDNGEQDAIVNPTSATSVTLNMQGLSANNLTFANDGYGDLVVGFGGSSVLLTGYVSGGESNVSLTFDDGSSLGAGNIAKALAQPDGTVAWGSDGAPDTITANDGSDSIGNLTCDNVVFGGAGYDTIYGGTGSDTIEAGTGGASVIGGTGTETYVYNWGDGNLVITEDATSAGSDRLEFGASINESDISFTRQGTSLVMLVDGGAAGRVDITNYFASPAGPAHTVASIVFADGTSLGLTGVISSLVYNNAYITGTSGSNLYRFDDFSGNNTIGQANASSTNTIQFTAGIDSNLIVARRDDSNDLILTDSFDGVSVTVSGYFQNSVGAIDNNFSINFADGSTWNAQQILTATMTPSTGNDELWGSDGNDVITGGPGNDTIIGVSGNNVLTGGGGNSTILGGSGTDTITGGAGSNSLKGGTGTETYVFELGNGSDTIVENTTTAGIDTLRLGAGIQPSDVTFAHRGGSNDLLIRFGATTGSTIVVQGFLNGASSGSHQLGSITFADGTSLTAAQVLAIAASTYASDNGHDTIQGGPGNNTIYGGSGSDTLIGGSGTNLIIGGSGTELIEGGSGYNTLIGGAGNDTLIAGPNGDLIDTGAGNALVETGAGNDTVNAAGGVDTLQPSNGNDTYQFGIGSGQDTLQGYSYYPAKIGTDTLLFGPGLAAGDLTFSRVGISGDSNDELVVGIKGAKDSFTIAGYFSYQDLAQNSSPLTLQFQDGSSLSFSEVEALADDQTYWNGAVNSVGTSPYPAGPSNTLQGSNFGRGDGALVLDPMSNTSSPTWWELNLEQGIRPQDVVLEAEGDSVLLSIKGTSDSLNIPGLLNTSVDGYALDSITFNDGTTWDLPTILQHVSYGSGALAAAGQVIDASTSADILVPVGPNDTINAIAGDTVHFGYGDGQTVLNQAVDASGVSNTQSTLVFGANILPSDISISSSDFGIVFMLKNTGESLTVDGASWDDWDPAIAQVQFANGTVWDSNNIQAMINIGYPVQPTDNSESWSLSKVIQALPIGTNVLFGGVNGATLDAGTGDALVVIDDGYAHQSDNASTTLNYEIGDGNVTVDDIHANYGYGFGNVSGTNTIQFGSGLTTSDIAVSGTFDYGYVPDFDGNSFASDGEGSGNLLLTIASTGKTITIPYWVFLDTSGQLSVSSSISKITFQDGETIDPASLILDGNANITAVSGVIVGARGAATLSGAAGDTIDAAIGNTVVLGSNQVIASDASSLANPTILPAESIYQFNRSTNGDTLSSNVASTLEFAPGIDESDVGIMQGASGTSIVYLKDSGAYVVLNTDAYINWPYSSGNNYWAQRAGAATVLTFADGKTFTPPNGYFFTGQENGIFTPTTPSITTDSSGHVGYYALDTADGFQELVVRGSVSNTFLGGNASNAFDAAAVDVMQLPSSMQLGIAPASLTQPVCFTFVPSKGDATIVNYDPNNLVIDLPVGVTAENLSVSETGGDIELLVKGADGTVNKLTIDGFYSQVAGSLQEKPLTIQFADGSTWSDQNIKQAIWQRSGGNDDINQGIWIAAPQLQTVDLTNSSYGNYRQGVEIDNDGLNSLKLGSDAVNAMRGSDTFVIQRNSNSIITNFDSTKDVIQFASDIDPSDIEVSQAYADAAHTVYSYMFLLRSTGVQLLTVSGSKINANDSLDAFVRFANGVAWSSRDIAGTQTVAPGSYYTGYNGYGSDDGLVVSQAIRGTVGDESLSGGIGDDVIAAGVGNDTLKGGGGHDTLYGGVGNDTFVFGHGSGHDTIVAGSDGVHTNTLAFTEDVASTDVSVVRPGAGDNLELILNDTGEMVLLANFFESTAQQSVQAVTFTDGTTWDAAELVAKSHQGSTFSSYLLADASDESIAGGTGNDTLLGDGNTDTLRAGSGNDLIQSGNGTNTIIAGSGLDTIYGGWGSDLIIAGAGNASVYGGTGAETYQFGPGFGQDTIVADGAGSGSNTIRFVDGINPNDVTFSLDSSGDMVISVDGSSSSILLPNHVVAGVTYGDVDNIQFADGTSILTTVVDRLLAQSGEGAVHYPTFAPGTVLTAGPADTLASDNGNDLLEANSDADTLTGGAGADTLISGAGSSLLVGGSGFETYQFNPGFGHDTLVVDVAAISNNIQFTGAIAPWDLTFSSDGTNLLITVAGSVSPDGLSSTILLPNHFNNGQSLTDDGQIVFGDGSVVTMAQVNQQFQWGGSPASIGSAPGLELVAPASGSDTLVSDNGDDTLIGGGGATTMIGGGYSDWMIAGTGYTYMEGGIGSECYEIDPVAQAQSSIGVPGGNGQTVISTNVDELWANTINFGGDITLSDLTFTRTSGTTLEIVANDGTSSEEVSVLNYFDASGAPTGNIQAITFNDGEQLSLDTANLLIAAALNETVQILADGITAVEASPWSGATSSPIAGGVAIDAFGSTTLSGVTDNDEFTLSGGGDSIDLGSGQSTVSAQASDNVILLGSGNNLIEAAGNSQSYVANAGFGNDTINGNASSTLSFGAGVRSQDIQLEAQGSDLIISDTVGGSIDLQGWYGNATSELQSVTFADGSTWTPNPMQPLQVFDEHLIASAGNESLTGTAGNDTLTSDGVSDTLVGGVGATTMMGGAGNDLIEAGAGVNYMAGGTGTETYEFGQSFGQTTLTVSPTENGANVIQFAPGVSSAQLSYAQSGSDLVITVTAGDGTTSTLAVINHFVNGAPISSDLSALTFADGSSVSMTLVNQQFASSAAMSATQASSTTAITPVQAPSASGTFITPLVLPHTDASMGSKRRASTSLAGNGIGIDSSRGGGGISTSRGGADGTSQLANSTGTTPLLPLPSTDTPAPTGSNLPPPSSMPTLNAGAGASPGAPLDPMTNDRDDPLQTSLGSDNSLVRANAGEPRDGAMLSLTDTRILSRTRGGVLGRTINVANDMVRALSASGGLQHLAVAGKGDGSAAQIQLQDGTLWSLSTLDRTMAAVTSTATPDAGINAPRSSFGSADLAHAQLISAMASFSPEASADTTLPPMASDAYAITIAAQMH